MLLDLSLFYVPDKSSVVEDRVVAPRVIDVFLEPLTSIGESFCGFDFMTVDFCCAFV